MVRMDDGELVRGTDVRFWDLLSFAAGALRGHRLRTALSVAGVAVGISAVVALTALGEGARQLRRGPVRGARQQPPDRVPGEGRDDGRHAFRRCDARPHHRGLPCDRDDCTRVRRSAPDGDGHRHRALQRTAAVRCRCSAPPRTSRPCAGSRSARASSSPRAIPIRAATRSSSGSRSPRNCSGTRTRSARSSASAPGASGWSVCWRRGGGRSPSTWTTWS